jgi:hypothetical protein
MLSSQSPRLIAERSVTSVVLPTSNDIVPNEHSDPRRDGVLLLKLSLTDVS